MDKVDEAFEAWWADDPTAPKSHTVQDAFCAGAAYQRAQDLAHVEAVRTAPLIPGESPQYSHAVETTCDEIERRIKGEEPGEGQ